MNTTNAEINITVEDDVAIATMHVATLEGMSISVNSQIWKASINIQVLGNNGEAVANTLVSGVWSNGYVGSTSCTTDAMGWCTVLTTGIKVRTTQEVTFTVTNLAAAGYTYDAAANVASGTITVAAP
jgi:hypothetical protein